MAGSPIAIRPHLILKVSSFLALIGTGFSFRLPVTWRRPRLVALHPPPPGCVADTPLPKLEEYEDYLYLVMHAVDYTRTEKFTTTELDLILGTTFLVTFHRKPLRPVQTAFDRHFRSPGTPVRGPDRFAHTILDLMIEAYKPALDELSLEIAELEQQALIQELLEILVKLEIQVICQILIQLRQLLM